MDKNLSANAGDTGLNLCGHYWAHMLQPLKVTYLEPCAPQQEKVTSLSRVWLFATPWTVAHQTSPSNGIFQARVLEWVAISFSRGPSQPRDKTWVSYIAGRRFTLWATRDNKKSHHNEKPMHHNEEQLPLAELEKSCVQ